MSRATVVLVALAGVAAGAVLAISLTTEERERPLRIPGLFDAGAPIEQRIAALETALAVERDARQLLEDELAVMSELLYHYDAGEGVAPNRSPVGDEADGQSAAEAVVSNRRESLRSRRFDSDARRDRLMEAGFSVAEAERILQRESELRMESIRARYEAELTGEPVDSRGLTETLRAELGDAGFERYLEANGRPTTVTVSTVYENSPALAAGIVPGDEIVHYDGRRVFSMNEISAQMLEGAPGQMITLDIVRDGVPMQISIPRGPLGVVGGRRYRR